MPVYHKGTFGKSEGRPKGRKNNKTLIAEEAIRNHILQSNSTVIIHDFILDSIADAVAAKGRGEAPNIKMVDAVAAYKAIAPYTLNTVAGQKVAETLDKIESKEDAQKAALDIQNTLRVLRAV